MNTDAPPTDESLQCIADDAEENEQWAYRALWLAGHEAGEARGIAKVAPAIASLESMLRYMADGYDDDDHAYARLKASMQWTLESLRAISPAPPAATKKLWVDEAPPPGPLPSYEVSVFFPSLNQRVVVCHASDPQKASAAGSYLEEHHGLQFAQVRDIRVAAPPAATKEGPVIDPRGLIDFELAVCEAQLKKPGLGYSERKQLQDQRTALREKLGELPLPIMHNPPGSTDGSHGSIPKVGARDAVGVKPDWLDDAGNEKPKNEPT